MKKIRYFLVALILAIQNLSCGNYEARDQTREFGVAYVSFEDRNFGEYMTIAPQAGSLIFWTEDFYWGYLGVNPPSIHRRNMAEFASAVSQTDLDIYLGVNLLAYSRGELFTPIPESVTPPNFSNPLVKTAFISECYDIVSIMQEGSGGKVKYMALVMEMNYYKNINPDDYTNLVDTVVMAKESLKADFPEVEIGVYFTCNGLWKEHFANPKVYTEVIGDSRLSIMDFLGASAYPGLKFFNHPEDIPQEYYLLAVKASPVPFHIPELGWASSGRSSPEEQLFFIEDFFNRQVDGLDVSVVIWFVLVDFSNNCPPVFQPFRSMGLWSEDFAYSKPSWGEWLLQTEEEDEEL